MTSPFNPSSVPANASAGLVLDRELVNRLAAHGTRSMHAPRSVIAPVGHHHHLVHLVTQGVVQVVVQEQIGTPLNAMRLAMWNVPPSPPTTTHRRLMGYVPTQPPLGNPHLGTVVDRPREVFKVTSIGNSLSAVLPDSFFRPVAPAAPPQEHGRTEHGRAENIREQDRAATGRGGKGKSKAAPSRGGAAHGASSRDDLGGSDLSGEASKKESQRRMHKELIVGTVGAGEFIGEMGLFVPALPRDLLLRAQTRVEVSTIPHNVFLGLLQNEFATDATRILYAIGHQLARRLVMAEHRTSAMAFLDVSDRVLRALLEIAYSSEGMTHPEGMQVRVSRQEIARLSGCSREMAGRALRDLEDRGRLRASGKTIVLLGTRG